MKKFLPYLLSAALAVVGCEKNGNNDIENADEDVNEFLTEIFWEQTEKPDFNLLSKERYTPEEMAERIFGTNEAIDSTSLEIKKRFLDECARTQEKLLAEDPNGTKRFLFETITFEYLTVDQEDKRRLELSCFIGYAVYGDIHGDLYAFDAENIFFCCPFTHTLEKECATASRGGNEFAAMWSQNLFIMPDGQGFGANKNHTQTYLNHELHAKQYYDAMKSGIWYFTHEAGKKGGKFKNNWKLRIAGASQGAGDAIAFHKYLDTKRQQFDLSQYYNSGRRGEAENLCRKYGYPIGSRYVDIPLCDVHRFAYSIVCCGPYCPEATMQLYSNAGRVSYPCVIPLVIKSMLECYPKELPYDEERFFSEKWNRNKADFDKIYLEKTMKSDKLNKYLVDKLLPGTNSITIGLHHMLSEEMLDTNSQLYKDLMACLKKQDLTSEWKPRTKTIIYFSEADEVVPCDNTKRLERLLKSTNSQYEMLDCTRIWAGIKSGHVATCIRFIAKGIFIW